MHNEIRAQLFGFRLKLNGKRAYIIKYIKKIVGCYNMKRNNTNFFCLNDKFY